LDDLDGLLTQSATISGRLTEWSSGAETLATSGLAGSAVPCLVVPMGPREAAMEGLALDSQPVLILFEPDQYVTETSSGERYFETIITAVGPQTRFGAGIDCDDVDHVEVRAQRRLTS
jgi:hypothetical protein